jgi:hypothetical protein
VKKEPKKEEAMNLKPAKEEPEEEEAVNQKPVKKKQMKMEDTHQDVKDEPGDEKASGEKQIKSKVKKQPEKDRGSLKETASDGDQHERRGARGKSKAGDDGRHKQKVCVKTKVKVD